MGKLHRKYLRFGGIVYLENKLRWQMRTGFGQWMECGEIFDWRRIAKSKTRQGNGGAYWRGSLVIYWRFFYAGWRRAQVHFTRHCLVFEWRKLGKIGECLLASRNSVRIAPVSGKISRGCGRVWVCRRSGWLLNRN